MVNIRVMTNILMEQYLFRTAIHDDRLQSGRADINAKLEFIHRILILSLNFIV